MGTEQFERLKSELAERAIKVRKYIFSKVDGIHLEPADLRTAVTDYLRYGGKMLRPGVLLFSCGAVGGNEETALPAAAAIELFHTWTLVHDDIIDQDEKRRGQDALHHRYYKKACQNLDLNLTDEQARHYGQSISILTGDTQHGLAISLLTELFFANGVDPKVVLLLIRELDYTVLNTLVSGETLDVLYSRLPIEKLTEAQIKAMLWGKTGALYEFAGRAGALIGLNTADLHHPYVQAISSFTSKCGLAFQLLDDILGIIGDEKKLGKPVGSDIREGKKTIIVFQALKHANQQQRKKLLNGLGNNFISSSDYTEIVELIQELGGIEFTKNIAHTYLTEALEALTIIPQSKFKDLLETWAHYMINRES